jgi:hypothetical protein
MGSRAVSDAPVTPHGAWQGARVGPLVSLWRCHSLAARAHGRVAVRDGVAERPQPVHTVLEMPLRAPDGPDDRLGQGLSMWGPATTPATLERARLRPWVRVSRLPTKTMRLDRTSVRVSHAPTTDERLCHQGHRTDQRPALRPCQALLATRAPLGLPRGCQPVAGNRAADGWSVPASAAAVTALGTSAGWGGGESTRGALAHGALGGQVGAVPGGPGGRHRPLPRAPPGASRR